MLLSKCVSVVDSTGKSVQMTEELLTEMNTVVTEMASRGLRTLGIAYTGGC